MRVPSVRSMIGLMVRLAVLAVLDPGSGNTITRPQVTLVRAAPSS
jgi:hypothetical protein